MTPQSTVVESGLSHMRRETGQHWCIFLVSVKYLSIFPYCNTSREDYVQVDCDLKSKCKNRKKKS